MAYKFQAGDATLSGSVTLVKYQDLLFESDGDSNIGAGAKEVGIIYTERITASVAVSASAVYADDLYGNGSGLTGISSENVKITASAQNQDLDIVLVGEAGTGKTLANDANGKFMFNPSTNLLNLGGQFNVRSISSSVGSFVTASRAQFRPFAGAYRRVDIDSAGLGVADASGTGSFSVSFAGAISGSSNANIGGTLKVAKNKFQVASDGDLSAVDGTFSGAISASSTLTAVGALSIGPSANAQITAAGAISASSTLSVAGNVQLDGADDSAAFVAADDVYFRDAGTGQMRRDSWGDLMTVAAGTVTTTGLKAASGVLSLDIANMTAATIATTDTIVFNDQNGDVLRQETVDDLFDIGPALVSAAGIAIADDYFLFLDGGATGTAKKNKLANLVAAMADGTTITSSAGVLSVVGAQNIDVNAVLGNASYQLTKAGLNFATASIATNVTYTLPASPTAGDIVYIKLAGVTGGKHAVISGSAVGNQTIDGVSAITASSPYSAISLVAATTSKWMIF